MEWTYFYTRDSYDKCQVFAIRFLPFRHKVFISCGNVFSKFHYTASKFWCKIQKTTCGTRAWSCRHFTPRNIRHAYVCSKTKNSVYNLFFLDLMEKCLANSNCKSQCIALVQRNKNNPSRFSLPLGTEGLGSWKAHADFCSMNNIDLFVRKVQQRIIFLSETICILSSPVRCKNQIYLESKQTLKCCVRLCKNKSNIQIWLILSKNTKVICLC